MSESPEKKEDEGEHYQFAEFAFKGRVEDEDEYRDGIYEELYNLKDNLFQGYLEVMKEREEDEKEEN